MPALRSLGLLLLSATALRADAARVRSVRIDASPEDQQRLQPFVELRPGDPLDPERLRHAVELIYAIGAYEDVRVETAPPAAADPEILTVPARQVCPAGTLRT